MFLVGVELNRMGAPIIIIEFYNGLVNFIKA